MRNANGQRSFRGVATLLLMIGLCHASGCELFRTRSKPIDDRPRMPANPTGEKPSAEQLISYMNKQADLLTSIETRDLEIDATAMGSSVDLTGSLYCQKPRYFKMVGKKPPFGEQVLLGSNDERFWFYTRQEATLFHCSHTDYEKGTSMELPVPFQPEWVLEVLGMTRITLGDSSRVEEERDTYKLIEETTFRGRKVRKVTVFYQGTARDNQPQIASRTIVDASTNQVICAAKTSQVTRVSVSRGDGTSTFVACPRVITLEWPQQEAKLKLDLGKVQVNQQLTMDHFQMPRVGSKQVDLGRDQPTRRVVPTGFR